MASYPLPRDTKQELEKNALAVSNYNLFFRRYLALDERSNSVEKLSDALLDIYSKGEGKKLLEACAVRHRRILAEAEALSYTAAAQGRVVVGLGDKGARDIGLTLHQLYGFPIIPGSSLKGLARTYALTTITARGADGKLLDLSRLARRIEDYAKEKAKAKAEKKEIPANADFDRFLAIFGAQDAAGAAVFFDALPTRFTLVRDIMNPHYGSYYRDKGKSHAQPADYYSPVPILFLAVEKGSEFRFGVAVRQPQFRELRQQAWDWLQAGLTTLGVGAKTTSGYGVFDKNSFHQD